MTQVRSSSIYLYIYLFVPTRFVYVYFVLLCIIRLCLSVGSSDTVGIETQFLSGRCRVFTLKILYFSASILMVRFRILMQRKC